MSFLSLAYAQEKMLKGDYAAASAYYERARQEGVSSSVVDLRYLTKNYLVYPLEYENSGIYFDLLSELHGIAQRNEEYAKEYVSALKSLLDLKRLFLRSVSLFYFSDIAVCSEDSVVLREIAEIQRCIKVKKEDILEKDIYEIQKFVPSYNKKRFARHLNEIEAFCMNILLSYTAEQHSVYQGKRYSAKTVDYGYFYSTTVESHDDYYNYANIKPRLFILGYRAYYNDILAVYREKLKELGDFDSPKVLREELTNLIKYKDKSDESAKEFIRYAKLFVKNDTSQESYLDLLNKFNPFSKLNFLNFIIDKRYIGSFELDVPFPRKRLSGVCSMISAGQGWHLDTTRWLTILVSCLGVGVFAYIGLAIAMRCGVYFGVTVEKP